MDERAELTPNQKRYNRWKTNMKRCSTSYAIRELQIKTRYHTTQLLEGLKFKTLTIPNADKELERELSFIVCGDAKWYSHFGKQFESFLQTKLSFTT